MTGSKTPHEGSLCAAEKAYVQYFEYRAMDYAVREYLRTLLSDERVFSDLRLAIAEVHSGSVDEANAIIREAISTLKRIAGVE